MGGLKPPLLYRSQIQSRTHHLQALHIHHLFRNQIQFFSKHGKAPTSDRPLLQSHYQRFLRKLLPRLFPVAALLSTLAVFFFLFFFS